MSTIEKFLREYTPLSYSIISCDLVFTISDEYTIVKNTIHIEKIGQHNDILLLNGVNLELLEISLNGTILDSQKYSIDEEKLTIVDLPDSFVLIIVTKIFPETNTALEGLFKSGSIYCTQNEPEGFRKITYFIDRPDCMTMFTTTINAPKKYPILLSNGNLIDSGEIDEHNHFTKWNDPFKKPAYLFALVAGDLGKISDTFTTMSGKVVDLHIFSEHGNQSKCLHAMESLKKSMKWDEDTYGREYDLNVFHIVAVDSFNMGAMENKSLNIFNTIYVLSDIETATDKDFLWVESVIGHEYFHNWTGNRITCRDWFQLTLKEGLTVFRDHDFSGDMNSRDTMRIEDIRDLREFQFGEDAGPTAHPIQPASYKEMNNFYTSTVYEKWSEVIRMMATLLGKEKFRKAMDLYFDTFDGQAVTTQDFVWAMATAGEIDLTQFEETWYHQERTPGLQVTTQFDSNSQTFTVKCTQIIDKNTKWEEQKPFFYPLGIALFNEKGEILNLEIQDKNWQERISDGILIISKQEESFVFHNVTSEPKLSVNRGFSAPIKVSYSNNDPVFLMKHETDGFARYEAKEKYTIDLIRQIMVGWKVSDEYLDIYGDILNVAKDGLYQSLLTQIPTINSIVSEIKESIDFEDIILARKTLLKSILERHKAKIVSLYHSLLASLPKDEKTTPFEIGTRAHITTLLDILSYSDKKNDIQLIAEEQYRSSRTMTLRLSSLFLLDDIESEITHPYIQDFISTYRNNPLVMMKYFSMVGSSSRQNVVERVKKTQKEPFYDAILPNHAKSLFGSFARNLEFFHKKDGSWYELITNFILEIDSINPHTSARMSGSFKIFTSLSQSGQQIMKPYLEKILSHPWISKNTEEIVSKILHSK